MPLAGSTLVVRPMEDAEGMMFDIGGTKKAQKASEALDALVNTARDEYSALTDILDRLKAPSATLVRTGERPVRHPGTHQTLQMMNQERELVERLEDSIRQLRKEQGI
jgi:hypothetical protein